MKAVAKAKGAGGAKPKAKAKAMSDEEKKKKTERDALAPTGKTNVGEHGYVIDKPGESKYRAFRSQTSPLGRMDVDVKYTMRDKQAAFDIAKDKIEG